MTRKAQYLATWPPKLNWEQISNQELEGVTDPPQVYFTRNPLKCGLETSIGVEYEVGYDRVRICKAIVIGEEDLRGGIRRELVWREAVKRTKNQSELVKAVIRGCKAELVSVSNLDSVSARIGAKVCAGLHARRKLPNPRGLQIDEWHFYTKQQVEDHFYAYDSES